MRSRIISEWTSTRSGVRKEIVLAAIIDPCRVSNLAMAERQLAIDGRRDHRKSGHCRGGLVYTSIPAGEMLAWEFQPKRSQVVWLPMFFGAMDASVKRRVGIGGGFHRSWSSSA